MRIKSSKIGFLIGVVAAIILLLGSFFCLSISKAEDGFVCIFPLLPTFFIWIKFVPNDLALSKAFIFFHIIFYIVIGWLIGYLTDVMISKKK